MYNNKRAWTKPNLTKLRAVIFGKLGKIVRLKRIGQIAASEKTKSFMDTIRIKKHYWHGEFGFKAFNGECKC